MQLYAGFIESKMKLCHQLQCEANAKFAVHIAANMNQNCCPASVAAVISRRHEGPGEMGKAVVIPKDEQEKMKELFKINQFNLMASDMIALNRSLPDVRLDGCVSSGLSLAFHCFILSL